MQAGTVITISAESSRKAEKSDLYKKRLKESESGLNDAFAKMYGIKVQYSFFDEMIDNKFRGFDEFIHVGHGDMPSSVSPKYDYLMTKKYFTEPSFAELKCFVTGEWATVSIDEKIYWDKFGHDVLVIFCEFISADEFKILGAFWYSELVGATDKHGNKILHAGKYGSYRIRKGEIVNLLSKSVI